METNRATEHMAKGYVCSESVLLGVCEELEIQVDDKIVPRIGRLFAGGIGRTGSVCGAVAGGVMALGLMVEPGETMDEALSAMKVAEEFRRRFAAIGSTIVFCTETGHPRRDVDGCSFRASWELLAQLLHRRRGYVAGCLCASSLGASAAICWEIAWQLLRNCGPALHSKMPPPSSMPSREVRRVMVGCPAALDSSGAATQLLVRCGSEQ